LNLRPADYECYRKTHTLRNFAVFALFGLPKGLKIGTLREEVLPKVLPENMLLLLEVTSFLSYRIAVDATYLLIACGLLALTIKVTFKWMEDHNEVHLQSG
jgi:hypothetical protein